MNLEYKHTQVGYLIIFFLGCGLFFILYRMSFKGLNWKEVVVGIVLVLCLLSFATLSVVVNEKSLKVKFGIGFIQKTFLIKDIVSCEIVKNPWYYGWGVRLMPKGVLYNVSGFDAVEIKMKTGKIYRIGTDKPLELVNVIKQFL